MKKSIRRLLIILVVAPVVVGIVYFDMQPYHTLPFLIFITGAALMGLNEYFDMAKIGHNEIQFQIGHFLVILLILLGFFQELSFFWNSLFALGLNVILISYMLLEVFLHRLFFFESNIGKTVRGILYLGWFFTYFILIRNLSMGKSLILFILFTIWALDIGAYMFGKLFGRHKLNPEISPKKTIEGSIGGFLTAVAVSVIYSMNISSLGVVHGLVLGSILGVLGQFGDLYESLIKRTYHVKDSSNIIPGHGGVMDRADSFIFIAPMVYYYIIIAGLAG